jgi:hypothetical protein
MTKVFVKSHAGVEEIAEVFLPEKMARRARTLTLKAWRESERKEEKHPKEKRHKKTLNQKRAAKPHTMSKSLKRKKSVSTVYTVNGVVVRCFVSGGLPGLGKHK